MERARDREVAAASRREQSQFCDPAQDEVTQQYLARFRGYESVRYVGRAQEKARVMRTERRRSRITGATYPWIVESTAMVNHY